MQRDYRPRAGVRQIATLSTGAVCAKVGARMPKISKVGLLALLLAGCGSSPSGSAPMCTSTTDGAPAMSPATFCQIFVASCPLTHDGYTTMDECVASY